jgi:hypothetical protein
MVFGPDDPIASRIGLGAAALRYLKLGYAVLPLQRGGKKPHRMLPESGGVHHATTYPSQVWEWWKQDPAANVGIACGMRSKLAVIDLDVKRGVPGPQEFYRLVYSKPAYDWESVPYVSTPSGGVHLWLRSDVAIPERPGILPGVDVKADGGLVVAPPSMALHHPASQPGNASGSNMPVPLPYAWNGCPCQVPQAPGWLAEWAHTAAATGTEHQLSDDQVADVEELKKTGVAAGTRNDTFYRLACSLYRRYGTDYAGAAKVMEELGDVYHATDKSGFTWNELLTIASSARRFIADSTERDEQIRRSWLARHHQ